MRKFMTLSLVAGVGAFALGGPGLHAAKAADMPVPQAQVQAPPPGYYGPPPGAQSYAYPPPPPPPVAYGYPPLPYYAYAVPPFAVFPGAYYGRGPYFRGYGPRFAYGYGRWGYRRW